MKNHKAKLTPSVVSDPLPVEVDRLQQTWGASRAWLQKEQKEIMARYFANHNFLVPQGTDPAVGPRETVASILVIQGTTPNVVVRHSLEWFALHQKEGPFHITWYSPSSLVPATLHEFRTKNAHLTAATHVHLFPGNVDLQLQASTSEEAVSYARRLKRHFSCILLSGYSFDLSAGIIRFHFDSEIPIQKACALLPATEKFLFLDSEKFTTQGEVGYSIEQLLATSKAVTIYTVSSPRDSEIVDAFKSLLNDLLVPSDSDHKNQKSLRLIIIGRDDISNGGNSTSTHSFDGILSRPLNEPVQPSE